MHGDGVRKRRWVAGVSAAGLLAAVALASCSTFQQGQSIARYERGAAVYSVKAPSTSDYELYESDGREPRLTVRLEEGEAIGFDKGANGLMAVAGDQRIPISYGSYTWRRR